MNDQQRPQDRQRVSLDGFVKPRSSQLRHTYPMPQQIRRPNLNAAPVGRTPALPLPPANQTKAGEIPKLAAGPRQPQFKPSTRGRRRYSTNHLKLRRISAGVLSVFLLLSISVGGWLGWKFMSTVEKVFGGSLASNIGDLFNSVTLSGESNGRVNLLLAGDSADDPNHGGAQLTDSIMVVSIDTKNNNVILLSIPRDLWVQLPDGSHQKINAANEDTSFSKQGYPSGGMGALQEVVQTELGIPINYYALIDYTAFRDAVDAVGGITVNIQSPDPRGLYDAYTNLKLPNGEDALNGQQALNLARARGDNAAGDISYGFPQSDFDRTQHQREELVALKGKASSIGVVSNPIKIGQLFDALGSNVQTNLNLADVLRLIQLTKGVSNSNTQSDTYQYGGTNPLIKGYYIEGMDTLIPVAGVDDFSQLQAYYQKLTSSNPVVKESATVSVLNGSTTPGLAKTQETSLVSKGLNVISIGNASKIYPTNTIIDNSQGHDPATLALLKSLYGNNVTTQQLETVPTTSTFIVILGQNQVTQ